MRLIDADAFDRALQGAQAECRKQGGNFRYGVLSTVRENLAMMPTVEMPGWVSVEDRLPEETESMFARFHGTEKWDNAMWLKESKQVIVAIEFPDGGRRVTLGRLHDSEWHTAVSVILPHTVTHWMPLPEPPEEVCGDA